MPTPIIVGVADIKNPSVATEDAQEPLELMLQAIHAALADTSSINLQSSIDSLSVVRTWTWPYADLPGQLAERLGVTATARHKTYTEHGGNSPAKILDETARMISRGEVQVGVITGGEALASLSACASKGLVPPRGWTRPNDDVASALSLDLSKFGESIATRHAVGLPIHVYPMYENAFRARRKQNIKENHGESARLYAEFARIAAQSEYSWNYGRPPATEQEIGSVSIRNRMICFPCEFGNSFPGNCKGFNACASPDPLLMNAFNNVNLAAAAVMTSVEVARELGIPENKWIYPLGGAGTKDSEHFPKLACEHLGIPIQGSHRPITLLGGLTSFGGAGNNYSMHAITEMVRKLRQGPAKNGLILANGGTVTYQHVVCLSKHTRRDRTDYPATNPLPDKITDVPVPKIVEVADGEAEIETYTVEYNRNGQPSRAFIVGRLVADGSRFLANDGDANTLHHLTSQTTEPIGRKGLVRHDLETKRNLFAMDGGVKL
ncbi:MAG: hypothetical protein GOMPHAMPRED_003821 [Gomphillus americanus]|uniref:Thiolase-like protein type 1 additional C-terminal domain-containing protein n=1 Tax=Gomphillus americanus TaxID=1940652 RepID=A0A8H3FQ53_9LECA|nr:MAG: hypothetical protein GOMPHAMPRED_003821 [Gomphillus americanus]